MKSNYTKYYVMQTAYALAMMFCSGTVLQAFLLESGFTDQQVYWHHAIIQIVQTVVLIGSMFFADLIKQTKKWMAFCILSLVMLFAAQFVMLAYSNLGNQPPVLLFYIMTVLTYCCIGIHSVESYRLPYKIMDISDYGRAVGVSAAISKVFCFGVSVLYSYMIGKFDYIRTNTGFFIGATVCVVLAFLSCFTLKEKQPDHPQDHLLIDKNEEKGTRNFEAFKNKATYFLLFPNFIRGITTGIVALLATIGISEAIIDTETSSYMNIAMQIALFLGNVLFAFTCRKKISVRKMMMISAVIMGIFLPLSIVRGNAVDFIAGYLIVQFFVVIMDTAIPVLVTEMIPYEQMGTFTAIRLSVYMFGSFVISIILDDAVETLGVLVLFIIASALQFICCLSYYLVARYVKKQSELTAETGLEIGLE